jgi:hypothetical protein
MLWEVDKPLFILTFEARSLAYRVAFVLFLILIISDFYNSNVWKSKDSLHIIPFVGHIYFFTVMNLYSRKARQPAELYDIKPNCRIAARGMHRRFWWWTTSRIRHGSLWRRDTESCDQRNVTSTSVYSQWARVWSWFRYIAVRSQCQGTQRSSAAPCLHIEGRRETYGWAE